MMEHHRLHSWQPSVTGATALVAAGMSIMENLRKQIAELETKAAEASLIADLASDPEARVRYTRLAQELAQAIENLSPQDPDRQFLLAQAEKCRSVAAAISDATTQAQLKALAAEFEAKARGA